jgi:transcription antitermination factor NusG
VPTTQSDSPTAHQRSQPAWYAIYTRHQHEKTVARILTSKGFEIFVPLYAGSHRWKDRTKVVLLPVFPCYVFLNGGLERRLDILTTPGIHSLVSCAGQPVAIPHSDMEPLRRVIGNGDRLEPHPFLNDGDWVRVKRGPLEGVHGFLVRKRNLYRLVLSVRMLGRAASVELDCSEVERINDNRPITGVAA